ncbi:Villin-4 [Platanthera guangdongensis]|uniref:Villin-4 n=1 Tax=Platanthera guangdongensis TaxID=2320717 RepID=A0ABR2N0Q4_9ASPA
MWRERSGWQAARLITAFLLLLLLHFKMSLVDAQSPRSSSPWKTLSGVCHEFLCKSGLILAIRISSCEGDVDFSGGISSGYKKFMVESAIEDKTYNPEGIALFLVQGFGPENMQAIQVNLPNIVFPLAIFVELEESVQHKEHCWKELAEEIHVCISRIRSISEAADLLVLQEKEAI